MYFLSFSFHVCQTISNMSDELGSLLMLERLTNCHYCTLILLKIYIGRRCSYVLLVFNENDGNSWLTNRHYCFVYWRTDLMILRFLNLVLNWTRLIVINIRDSGWNDWLDLNNFSLFLWLNCTTTLKGEIRLFVFMHYWNCSINESF